MGNLSASWAAGGRHWAELMAAVIGNLEPGSTSSPVGVAYRSHLALWPAPRAESELPSLNGSNMIFLEEMRLYTDELLWVTFSYAFH